MSNCCRVATYMIQNCCSYVWNYLSINCFKRSILCKTVYVNTNNHSHYKTIVENFYMCNDIHTIKKLTEMLELNFDDILFILEENNTHVFIDRNKNTITVDGDIKRIILGDISLSYILG
jgi:hypothetical protein